MENTKKVLTLENLYIAAKEFCLAKSKLNFPELLGIIDGKAVGTFVEHRLKHYLSNKFNLSVGNSASGIDLPETNINTDIKVTSIRQPQSSCPYKSSRQKIFGLGYNLLVLVYEKTDVNVTSKLDFKNCTFVSKERAADFTTTKRFIEMIHDGAIKEDIIAYFMDKNIPCDEVTLEQLADEVMEKEVLQDY